MVLPKSDFKGGGHQTWLPAKSPEKWAVKLEKNNTSVHGKKYIAMFDDQRVPSFVRFFWGSVWGTEIILGMCRSPFFGWILGKCFFLHMSLLMMMWPRVKNIEKHCSPMLTHGWMDFILQRWMTTWRADTEVSTRIRPVSGYQTMFRLNHTINTWNNYSRHSQGTIFAGKNHSTDWLWRTTTILIFGGFLK